MKKLRAAVSLLLCTVLLLPAAMFAAPNAVRGRNIRPEPAVIDTDGSDGYTGDYVVIYNPSTNKDEGAYTGSLEGLIEESAGADDAFVGAGEYELDIDSELVKKILEESNVGADTCQHRISERIDDNLVGYGCKVIAAVAVRVGIGDHRLS